MARTSRFASTRWLARKCGVSRGAQVKATGDGILATFDGPARAVRCAQSICAGAHQLGLEVRAGLHTGEVEVRGDDVGGIAVHLAQRVSSRVGAGEVLVSRTVVDLVTGSAIAFDDRGIHSLKGIEGAWGALCRAGPNGSAVVVTYLEAYDAVRRRLGPVLSAADPQQRVPACPGWSVGDVLAHLVGLCEDWVDGRFDGYASEPWTAAHLQRRRGDTRASLLNRWRATMTAFAMVDESPLGASRPAGRSGCRDP